MSDAFGQRPFPRGALIAVATLLGFVILMVSIARLTGTTMELAPVADEVQVRQIGFVEFDDGSLAIRDAATGDLIQTLAAEEGGFIRGVLRSMARQRKGYHADLSAPFHLARRASGHLTFMDPITGIRLELRAFGASNEAAFAQLLPALPATNP